MKIVCLMLCCLFAGLSLHAKTTPVGIALITKYEGLSLKAYKCPAGIWTIGYGHTRNVKPGQTITIQQAINYLKLDIFKFEKYILRTIPRLLLWHEFDALVSFTYNLGYRLKGTLKKAIISGNTKLVAYKIKLYNKAKINGKYKVLSGLIRRRNDEAHLYAGQLKKLNFYKPGMENE